MARSLVAFIARSHAATGPDLATWAAARARAAAALSAGAGLTAMTPPFPALRLGGVGLLACILYGGSFLRLADALHSPFQGFPSGGLLGGHERRKWWCGHR